MLDSSKGKRVIGFPHPVVSRYKWEVVPSSPPSLVTSQVGNPCPESSIWQVISPPKFVLTWLACQISAPSPSNLLPSGLDPRGEEVELPLCMSSGWNMAGNYPAWGTVWEEAELVFTLPTVYARRDFSR